MLYPKSTVLAALLFASPLLAVAKGFVPVASPTGSAGSVQIKFQPTPTGYANLVQGASSVSASGSVIAEIAKGVNVAAAASAAVSGAQLAGAWGAAVGVVGVVALAAIPAIKTWMQSAGVTVSSSGQLQKPAPGDGYYWTSTGGTRVWDGPIANCEGELAMQSTSSGVYFKKFYKSLRYNSPTEAVCVGDVLIQNSNDKQYDQYGQDLLFVYRYGAIPNYNPAPVPSDVATSMQKLTAASPTSAAVQALIDLNFPPEVTPLSTSGPATVGTGNTVKLGLDGSRTTEVCQFYIEYFPSTIAGRPECTVTTVTPPSTDVKQVTTTNPDGTTSSQTITTVSPGTTVTGTTTAPIVPPDKPSQTCGLPGTPACKIDESGTPDAPALNPLQTANDVLKPLRDLASNPRGALPPLPSLNWSFQLPTGCTDLSIPAFAPFLSSINVCQFLPMFHEIMSIVWLVGGLFGAIGLFWRNTFSVN